jgi:hypothetical protein
VIRNASLGLAVAAALAAAPLRAQTCTAPHYRWTEKTEESLASLTPTRTYVSTMLRSWGLLELTGQAIYKCSDRQGRELRGYSLVGWLRRVKKAEADGDWHVEVTARQGSPTDSCIVAEIPPIEYGGNYAQARADLDAFLATTTVRANGDLDPPLRVRLIGAAFFDGEHRGGPTRRDQTDGAHGRCNSSARALWELHPVYWVRAP